MLLPVLEALLDWKPVGFEVQGPDLLRELSMPSNTEQTLETIYFLDELYLPEKIVGADAR